MSQKEFAVGDEVIWTSQAQGYEREKTGTVVAVLKPHARFTNKHQESFLICSRALAWVIPATK